MKCLLFTSILSGGGAERVICQLANNLLERNVDVILVAAYKTQNEYVVSNEIRKFYIDNNIENKHSFRQIYRLRALIKKEKPDICISFLPQPNFKMLLASIGLKAKTIISIRSAPELEYASLKNLLLAKLLYNLSDGVVFQTKEAQKWFPPKIQNKSSVIMNLVDQRFFDLIKGGELYYVATGRLNNNKNYKMMIRAFANFLKMYPSEKLYIYGEGDQKEELLSFINELEVGENVCLMGLTEDVPDILSKAKAFLLTSNYEGMPNGLLEAMATGLPCISTDCPCGGPKMLIENKVNGILIPVKSDQKLYEALCYLEDDVRGRIRLGMNAKKTSILFSPQIIYEHWYEYIQEIISNKKANND